MVYTIVVHLYAKEDQESISKLTAKLQEASQVYSRDLETLSWYVPFLFSYGPHDFYRLIVGLDFSLFMNVIWLRGHISGFPSYLHGKRARSELDCLKDHVQVHDSTDWHQTRPQLDDEEERPFPPCAIHPQQPASLIHPTRFVMQDTKDPRAFTIVERYAQESVRLPFSPQASQPQRIHPTNPIQPNLT